MSSFFAKSFAVLYNIVMTSLINKILQGDEHAVETFYRTYAPEILQYLKHKLPREEDAQEIVNDVFLDAVDALPTLQAHTNAQAWLYRIAHNKMVNFYRKRKIKSFLFSQFPFLKLAASEISQPEFQLEKKEAVIRMQLTLQQLSQNYQNILQMHYLEDMPIKTIAIRLDLSHKAAESLLYRARQRFIKDYERT